MGDISATMIKSEPDEPNNPHQFMMSPSAYGIPTPSYGNQFGGSGTGTGSGAGANGSEGIDPSELTMQQNGFVSHHHPFGSQNLSSSFTLGNAGIDTDELLDLEINGQNLSRDDGLDQRQPTAISMSHQGQMSHIYSNTPDGAPIQSPFLRSSFNYDQFRQVQHTPQATSPHMNAMNVHFDQNYSVAGKAARNSFQGDARSPVTPKTPGIGIGGLNINTPDSGSYSSQPIRAVSLQSQHQKSMSGQWNGTPGSAQSLMESPISSPGGHHASHHANIHEMLKSAKHASLPAKVDSLHGHHHSSSSQSLESQEAKRRRRRASHNMVERRRRDNINERIQDLSHLVPQHRLEDEKIRKQLVNNSALSTSSGANASSPPNHNPATSLLAGPSARRATAGNITMGLPIEEKEKGPNKGDILNGAVGWTRDLMWALHRKLEQEDQLAEYIASLGGQWPFEQTEEDRRMRTEVFDAMEANDGVNFSYSRGVGSGLRVPKHTTISGESLPQSNSPSQDQSQPQTQPQTQSQTQTSGNSPGFNSSQFWNSSGHIGLSVKEEDEYAMEI
ncbi:HLH transcription factor [Trichophyton violaceum]|uniref:HLH transcription factor n=1 Tax=Trichophyton violaceum TaxID=34388 RepID=A0A178FDZ4_TRIVO|nr:HLH transcription factor [Trichophyton violaceum]